jgi:hypothetical protein
VSIRRPTPGEDLFLTRDFASDGAAGPGGLPAREPDGTALTIRTQGQNGCREQVVAHDFAIEANNLTIVRPRHVTALGIVRQSPAISVMVLHHFDEGSAGRMF